MENKEEIMRLIYGLAREAKNSWTLRDGLAGAARIRNECNRIDEAYNKIVAYLDGQDK